MQPHVCLVYKHKQISFLPPHGHVTFIRAHAALTKSEDLK